MRALAEDNATNVPTAWGDFLTSAREVQAELQGWEQLLEHQFGELEFLQAELERQAEATEAMQQQLAERHRQLEEERTATGRLTHKLDQQDARLTEALTNLAQLALDLKTEREAAGLREQALLAEHGARESAWQAERDELRAQLAAAVNTLPPVAAAVPAIDAQTKQELAVLLEERTVLDAELTVVRSRAAELQEVVNEQKRLLAERQEELTVELKQLRELLADRPWDTLEHGAISSPPHEESSTPSQPTPVTDTHTAPPEKVPDPLVDSVMAQFARLQKDVAQRRKQK
jgi:chromosome segregation ATPase